MDALRAPNPATLALAVTTATFAFVCCKTIYRLWLHPLQGIPGPKLASATTLYKAYYDLWKHGEFVFKLTELHEIYGTYCKVFSLMQLTRFKVL